jgi:hypothetical protein
MFYEPTGIIVEENCRYEVRMDCDMDLGNSMKGGDGGNYYWRYNLQMAASDLHGHYVWSPAKFQGTYDWSTDYVLHGWQHVDWTSNAMGVQRNGATMPVGSEIHGEIWIKGLQNGGTLVFRNLHFDLTVHRWRMVDDVWVRDGGQWKRATEIQVRSGGAWRV